MTKGKMMRFFSRITLSLSILLVLGALVPTVGRCDGPRVAVLPWKVNATGDMGYVKSAMTEMLVSRLGAAQTEMVRPDRVSEALASKKGEINDAGAVEAGRALKADFVLYGSLTIFGNAVSLDARLVNVKTGEAAPFASTGTGLDSIIGLAERLSSEVVSSLNPARALVPVNGVEAPAAAVAAPAGLIIKADKAKEQPVIWRGRDMDGMYVAMTAADLDKDGAKEIFLISGRAITVARYGANGMEVIKEIKDKRGQNVAITSIDSDGDGVAEVYVSRIVNDRPASQLIEYRGGQYSVAASDIGWMVRAVSMDGSAPVLVGQRFRAVDGFYGGLVRLRKDGGALKEEGAFGVDLPGRVNIYGFEAFGLTGAKGTELVALDDRQYLTLYAMKDKGWELFYKSADYYGGTLNRVDMKDAGAESKPVMVEGRYLRADMDEDGRAELIIKRNTPGGLGRSAETPASFKTGEIISLSWDDKAGAPFENWRTRQVEGYIADFFIDDLDADGNAEVTMLVVSGTEKLFGTVKSYVLSYRISL